MEAEPEPPVELAPESVVMVCGRARLWGWGWVLAACAVGAVAGMFAWLAALAAARGGLGLDSLLVVLALAGVAAWLERGIVIQLKLELRRPAVWLAVEGLACGGMPVAASSIRSGLRRSTQCVGWSACAI